MNAENDWLTERLESLANDVLDSEKIDYAAEAAEIRAYLGHDSRRDEIGRYISYQDWYTSQTIGYQLSHKMMTWDEWRDAGGPVLR